MISLINKLSFPGLAGRSNASPRASALALEDGFVVLPTDHIDLKGHPEKTTQKRKWFNVACNYKMVPQFVS